MKQLLLIMALLFASQAKTYVYICTGPQSECYHKTKACKGIKNCSKTVKEVTLSEAIDKYHRRPCGYCYKKRH